jgi:imidazolonepropionase-like amidohydrolase
MPMAFPGPRMRMIWTNAQIDTYLGMRKFWLFGLWMACANVLCAQVIAPVNGVKPKEVVFTAFTNATIQVDAETVLANATLLVFDDRIVEVGVGLQLPPNTVIRDCTGLFICPSLIDLHADYGLPKVVGERPDWRNPQMETNRKGAFGWNQAIRSDYQAVLEFAPNPEQAPDYRNNGFGAVLTQRMDGIARGTSALVGTGSRADINVYKTQAAQHFSFSKGTSTQDYPSSLMGSIALLRQTYYDAKWYEQGGFSDEENVAMRSWIANKSLPSFFDAGNKWNVLRADKIGDEFGVQYIIRGGGDEYQRIAEIKASGAKLIIPVNFPLAYDVTDPYNARYVSTAEMKHWELAPYNASYLAKANIEFVFTMNGLSDKSEFLKQVRKAIQCGLDEKQAWKALTTRPAEWLGASNEVGALRKNMRANFIIASSSLFKDECVLREHYISGEQFVLANPQADLSGTYELQTPKRNLVMEVAYSGGKNSAKIQSIKTIEKEGKQVQDTTYVAVQMQYDHPFVNLQFEMPESGYSGLIRLTGSVQKDWKGSGLDASNTSIAWSAVWKASKKAATTQAPVAVKEPEGKVVYPFAAYGSEKVPQAETVLIINATIWTCDAEGIIENGSLLIRDGKIAAVGKNLDPAGYPGVKVIDAKGKHVTPGIIDEHSHIGAESINEGAQSCTAEVEEISVLWPEDIDIYRQLTGGVTTSQILHGSANAIGGQSAIIKLRWGANADGLVMREAKPFIKFALGENVTHMNYGNDGTQRFPQTRMGVEQLYYDHFIRAREYGQLWDVYNAKPKGNPKSKKPIVHSVEPRRDLEMDALYQILKGERFVTCHSYVQSEINMLMHVADSMGFTLNTFTHILEGYKIADKMKAHGSNASTFSDWWAYKYEVKDATPFNGALMWQMGLNVAYNSDDAEMARRLNQEAAKAVKYGGVPEQEALKFVTLNPAKMLHIDDYVGSLKVGKQADVVIWSDHPLSIYSRAEYTFVDGVCYFSLERNAMLKQALDAERARLIQRMLNASAKGEPTQKPIIKDKKHYHCDTLDETGLGIWNHK